MNKEEIFRSLEKCYFSEEMHEKDVIKNLSMILKRNGTFVDIGASLGQYTYFANQYMKRGKIIAIEPDPIRFEKLELNCKKWAGTSNNEIQPIHAAISDSNDKIPFFTTKSNISGGLFKTDLSHLKQEDKNNVSWEEIEVESLTLDSLFPDSIPDCIKIDVEGSELRVLKGAKRIFKVGRTIFLVEIHHWADPAGQRGPDEVFSFFKKFSYNRYKFYGKFLFVNNLFRSLPLQWVNLKWATIFKDKKPALNIF